MVSIKEILVSLFSGILIGLGWWAFFDGVVYSPDRLPWYHIVPPIMASIAFICTNLATLEQLKEQTIVKVWIFIWLTVGCLAIGGSIWITVVEYPPDITENWPGVAIIVQAVILLIASLLFFIGRSAVSGRFAD